MPARIVVLEDDASAANLFTAILQQAGYDCVPAASCWEVQQQCAAGADLLIADQTLRAHPECHGTDVALRTLELYPIVRVLFISGTPLELWSAIDLQKLATLPGAVSDFLGKPFTPDVLLAKVEEMLNRPPPTRPVKVQCPYRNTHAKH